ncbi:acetoacetate decarboxylase family protein [Zavarzinia compransoris]|uniref:acetoacetate decarboxylase family protein n=1 Tax=Zavarzinia marina TaxID=2911065 RepID=UPI001F38E621|nr:acetoacetate decarboxylase family protein [Zavarzinia marina]MCF4164415.1 acetoacetate decarboxylase family protein [Zavarzinia marina]
MSVLGFDGVLQRLPATSVMTGADKAAAVVDAPAPWAIRGRGFACLLRMDGAALDGDVFAAPELKGRRRPGRLAIMMYVDYAETPAGPYRELLFIPGSYEFAGRRFWAISRIFVSTMDSVVNGRRNWGIPKEQADFAVTPDGRRERVTVTVAGRPAARFTLKPAPLTVPVTTALVPEGMRRLGQVLGNHLFVLAPSAAGKAGLGGISDLWSDPALFPDLSRARPLLTAEISRFHMTFPLANITPL